MGLLCKKLLSLVLSIFMLVGTISLSSISVKAEGDTSGDENSSITWEDTDGKDIKSIEPVGKIAEELTIAETNIAKNARVSIIVDGKSTLEAGYSANGIASNNSAKRYRADLLKKQQQLAERISKEVLNGKKLDVVWNITLAANIISAEVPITAINRIKKVKGVLDVLVENQYEAVVPKAEPVDPNMSVATDMTNTVKVWGDYTGAGEAVAIVDTGLDTDHRSFAADAFDYAIENLGKDVDLIDKADVEEVLSQLNSYTQTGVSADQLYLSTKVPYAFNYIDRSLDVTHDNDGQGEHGSHVSGIAAANRYVKDADGNYIDALTEVHTQGQAPDAQIFVMKVFGKGGGAYDSDYFVAIEDAIMLGAASVNLSLGSANAGFTSAESVYMSILDELSKSETVAVMSAGNNYDWTNANLGDLYADDVNFATGGTPGSLTQTFTVASIDNDGYTGAPITAYERNIFFEDGGGTGVANAPLTSISGEYSYIAIDGFGTEEEMTALKDVLAGKIAVVSRGTTSFFEKANAAISNGAAALLIYNNTSGTISMNLAGYTYTKPVASILQVDGQFLIEKGEEKTLNDITYYEGTLSIPSTADSDVITEEYDSDYYTMSDFSSWGTTGDLNLKPEITAPGGNIYSVNGLPAGGYAYENMSGTSMAAPEITGITAVLRQYINEAGLAEKTGLTDRQLALSLLMSTAKPVVSESNDYYYSLLKQGAGLVDIEAAVNSKTLIQVKGTTLNGTAVDKKAYTSSYEDGKVKALFGEDADRTGKYTVTFDVMNFSDEDVNVELDGDMFTQDMMIDEYGDLWLSRDTHALSAAKVSFEMGGQPVTLKPDFDGDGVVTRADAVALLEYVTGVREEINDIKFADLDVDGDIDTYDAYLALDEIGKVAVSVEAGKTITVTATIDLNGTLDELGSEELNGNYVEGYLNVKESPTKEGVEGVKHSIPVLGYYGSWSEAGSTDKGSYLEYMYGEEARYPYMAAVFENWQDSLTNEGFIVKYPGDANSYMFGGNPFTQDETYHEDRNAITSKTTFVGPQLTLIRNAGGTKFLVEDAEGNVLSETDGGNAIGAFYYRNQATWYNTISAPKYNYVPTDVKEGTALTFTYRIAPEYYVGDDGKIAWDKVSENGDMKISAVIDNTAPVINEEKSGLEENVLNITAGDNEYISAVALYDKDGNVLGEPQYAAEDDVKGAEKTYSFELAEDGSPYLYVEIYDYAMNKTVKKINLNADEEYEDPTISITVAPENVKVVKGTAVQLTAEVLPWAYNDNVTWTSADESIATVDENGLVTGVAVGTTTITVVPEADPELSATATVTVVSIEVDLNAMIWDENGERNFSTFNTGTIPAYKKLSGGMSGQFTSAARDYDGTLYAVTLDNENFESTLYTIDEENGYAATEIGDVALNGQIFSVHDLAEAPASDVLVGVYGPYVLIIDKSSGAIVGAVSGSGIVEGDLIGITYLYSDSTPYGLADFFLVLDNKGKLYAQAILQEDGEYYNLMKFPGFGEAGAETSMAYWNSLYYYYDEEAEDEYVFWSRFEQAENKVDLIAVGWNDETGLFDVPYAVGTFADEVWPVSGLYGADAVSADAGNRHLPSAEMSLIPAETESLHKIQMNTVVKGSANAVNAENDPIDIDVEGDGKVTDVKVITLSAENADTNALYVVDYNPEELELVNAYGFPQYHAVNKKNAGQVKVGFISEEAVDAGTKIGKLIFKVLDREKDIYIDITTVDENDEKPGTVEHLLVSTNQTVPAPVKVTGLTLNATEVVVAKDAAVEMTATVTPEDATDKTVRWMTTRPSIATVDENGVVTGVAPGFTWLIATTVDGGYNALCKIQVVIPVSGIELNKTETTIRVGKTETLVATVTPEDATDVEITWTSSDPSIATVDENGVVTGVADNGLEKPSEAVITASTADGTITAQCTVYVADPINAFVRRLYSLCFDRDADEVGFPMWTEVLRNKTFTASQVVLGFFLSDEMNALNLSSDEFVERCYLVMMDRSSDPAGKKTWVDLLNKTGNKRYILFGFVESDEFKAICADFGIEKGTIKYQ